MTSSACDDDDSIQLRLVCCESHCLNHFETVTILSSPFKAYSFATRWWRANTAVLLGGLLHQPVSVKAVMFFSTGDPAYNTTAPAGALADSGWQLQGLWGGFLGTPIAPRYFITAGHVGGRSGDPFVFQNVVYTAQSFFDDPDSDLRIWRICETFPIFATLYTNRDEVNKSLVVFGRGTVRGDEVRANGVLKGWRWGPADGVQRWGENRVSSVVQGRMGIGGLLKASFNADAGANEAHLSVGDSGGAVFIKEGAVWKLAGINYSVDGPYSLTNTGPGFEAAIFDKGGLYTNMDQMWRLEPDSPSDKPGAFYATRISENAAWINSVLGQTFPDAPVVESAEQVAGPYALVPNATVDAGAKTITVTRSSANQFYRLSGCIAQHINGLRLEGNSVIISYD